jgi:hypothetical protein
MQLKIECAFDAFGNERNGGVIVTNARAISQRQLIGTLGARHHLPAVSSCTRPWAASGGLI